MTGRLSSSDVVVGMCTENTPAMLTQALRLVRSIRWFGGELAHSRIVVCGVGPLEPGARTALESLGAEVRTVTRFHPANPTANKHRVFAELLDAPESVILLLDCDTIVTRDPLPYLGVDAFQAKIAPTPTVTDEVFDRLFTHFRVLKPPRTHLTPLSLDPTIPYFNAGVVAVPRELARVLHPVWLKYNLALAEDPSLAAPCQRHIHQASLSLALVETGIRHRELPVALNFQINATHLPPPPGFAETDPVIIHYHHLGTEDGFLLPCPYPATQARIERFHERLRAEGFRERDDEGRTGDPRAVVVTGMHRSGTSLVAHVLHSSGVFAGRPDELLAADMFNPTGYWEHMEVVALDMAVLKELHATWTNAARADLGRLPEPRRSAITARARAITESLGSHGPFLIKDPRISLLFPLWREVLPRPVCVIAWRHPLAVARSIATRDGRPLLASVLLWEHYNRTLLRATRDVPRVLVSYDELLRDPERVVRTLHRELAAFGVPLDLPTADRLSQIVQRDFNRSGRTPPDEALLDDDQRSLLADLRSGAAVQKDIAPTSRRALQLLEEFATLDALAEEQVELRSRVAYDDSLLNVVFASRSWRIGKALTGVLRRIRRDSSLSAEEHWRIRQSAAASPASDRSPHES